MSKVPIIYYHEIVDGEGYSYQKTAKYKFEEQMRFLKENGYNTIQYAELKGNVGDRSVIVSFDDGFSSVYQNAVEIMDKYGIKGTVYLPTAFIGNHPLFMNWDMVREASEILSYEAHTHTHSDMRWLSGKQICEEIKTSDEIFLRELSIKPSALCFPFGAYKGATLKCLKDLNRYDYLLSSCYGAVSIGKTSPQKVLPRIGISNTDSIETFEKKITGKLSWKGNLQKIRWNINTIRGQRLKTDW